MAESTKKHMGSLTYDMYRPDEHPNILGELAQKYGHKLGKSTHKFLSYFLNLFTILVPYSSELVEVTNDEHQDYGLIDSIHYKGGPISQKEHSEFRRQHFTDGHKLAMRKKKEGNDDSESDNSDKSGTRPRPKRKATAKGMVRALDDSKKQTLSEDACNGLDKAEDSDCVHVTPKKREQGCSRKQAMGLAGKELDYPLLKSYWMVPSGNPVTEEYVLRFPIQGHCSECKHCYLICSNAHRK